MPPVTRALPGLVIAMLMGALDQTVMTPALPAVAGDLGGLDQMPLVATAYLVAATAVMPLYGKLGDRFGRKPLMQAAIVIFVAGAVLCALATTMPQLVAFRAVQGAGGGGLMIGAQAVLGELVSPRERGRYLGLIGAAYVVAAVGGPVLGGLVVDGLGWRWIFAVYPPLGLAALVVLTRTLRLPRPPAGPPVDYAGALTLALTVVGLVVGVTAAPGGGPGWLALAAAAGLAWLATARRAADPVLPLRLFRDRAFAVPAATGFLIGFALFGTLTYLPAYLQIAQGATATGAGTVVTVLMAGVLVTTVGSGRLITRTGRYKAYPVAGTALATAGMALLAATTVTDSVTDSTVPAMAALLLLGLGVGLVMQVMVLAAQNAVPYADLGAATSAVTLLRQVGASLGVAAAGALATWRFTELYGGAVTELTPQAIARLPEDARQAVAAAFGQALPPVFAAMTPLLGLAFLLTLALPARPLRTTAHTGGPS
ncbi:MFS transporter [Thermoactinospora rubra]|uniref:MFS transporter n=1 Tax=Thermoactinospora rubra TaxID=1088767 RepID=UPI001F0A224F|nr:MFS transporter [Thermoactinospora rubra]